MKLTPKDVQKLREERFRRRPDLRLHSDEEAARFIDAVGFCLLFPAPGVELPNLWEAINGRERALPKRHFDRALSLTWNWKDSLPTQKRVYYGKLLRQKPTFVSLRLFPHFYALSDNYGEIDDYLEEYAEGKMSEEAKRIFEVLVAEGPSTTGVLRRAAGLYGKEYVSRFDRAIAELQTSLKIVKSGTSDANRWKYCYVYDVLIRHLPDQVLQAREIKSREAMREIILAYLENLIVAPVPKIAKLFGWELPLTRRVIASMVADGTLIETEWDKTEAVALTKFAG